MLGRTGGFLLRAWTGGSAPTATTATAATADALSSLRLPATGPLNATSLLGGSGARGLRTLVPRSQPLVTTRSAVITRQQAKRAYSDTSAASGGKNKGPSGSSSNGSSSGGSSAGKKGDSAAEASELQGQMSKWLGRPKEKYDPFEENVQAPIPLSGNGMTRTGLAGMAMAVLAGAGVAAYQLDQLEIPEDSDHYLPSGEYSLADKARYAKSRLTDPYHSVLLPPPLPAPYHRPYTLVLDLDGTLVHTTWDKKNGYRTMKRPGVDVFLDNLAQMFEIVVFTETNYFYSGPVLDGLDPTQGKIVYRLYKDSTTYINGEHVKDLSRLGRPLERVLIIDDSEKAFAKQPENAIHISKWDGDPNDRELIELIPFLQTIFMTEVQDVREVIKLYGNKDIGKKFANVKAQLLSQMK